MKKDQTMKEIEELLKMVPTYDDTRTKDEVFARLKKEGVFDEKRDDNQKEVESKYEKPQLYKSKNQSVKMWVMAAIAFVTFAGVGSYLISQNGSFDTTSSDEEKAEQSSNMDDRASDIFSQEMDTNEASIESVENERTLESSIVWPNTNGIPFTIGLVTDQLEVVPVTILIEEQQLIEQFGDVTPSNTDLYQYVTANLDEESYGFIKYHPIEGQFAEIDGQFTLYLHQNHQLDMSSATEGKFFTVLNTTFGKTYSDVEILTSEGGVPEFSHYGSINNPVKLEEVTKSIYYVTETLGNKYIAPYELQESDIEQALQQLKQSPDNMNLKSPIIDGVQYDVINNGDNVTIYFEAPVSFGEHDGEEIYRMLDAIIMTAASYNVQVKFENVVDVNGNAVHYPETTELPIGANKIILKSN